MKYTVEQQKKMFPFAQLKKVFMAKTEIKALKPSQQKKQWKKQRAGITGFMKFLSKVEGAQVLR